MIIYEKKYHKAPTWIQGAPNLAMRKLKESIAYGVGPAYYLGAPPNDHVLLDDGWKCWINKDGPQVEILYRNQPSFDYGYVPDSKGNLWNVPIIVDSDGERAFKVSYGADWKPILSPRQETLLTFAREAHLFLQEADKVGKMLNPAPGCAWAAAFLEESMYLTSEVIAKLGLMDDILMVGVLQTAISRENPIHAR